MRRSVLLALALAPPLSAQLVTDRPDFVEAAATVGSGVVQVETSVAYSRTGSEASKEAAWTTPSLIRVGVAETLELRLESELAVVDASARGLGAGDGVADVALGFKWHAADAGGLRPSAAVLVHAGLPTGSRGLRGQGVRPSLRVVGEWELPGGLGLGLMPGVVFDSGDAGRYTAGILGVVVGREMLPRLRGFLEMSLQRLAPHRHGGNVATWDTGLTHLVSDDLQLDFAVSLPASDAAPDWSMTVGVSRRFGAR